jgi:hypothetical protein
VLEGAARAGAPVGRDGQLRTVHARGSGDDEIVVQANRPDDAVVVVTADRMLQSRVSAVGATSMSPSWLLERL